MKQRWRRLTKDDQDRLVVLEEELAEEIMGTIMNWCELKNAGELTPPLACGAALHVAASLAYNAHRDSRGPGLKVTLGTIRSYWELGDDD